MKWFRNLKIAVRLVIGFILIAVIAAVVGIVGMVNLASLDEADTLLYEENLLGVKYSGDAATYYQRLRYNIAEMVLLKDDSLREDYTGKFETFITSIDDSLNKYEEGIISDEDRKLFDELEPTWNQYRTFMQEAIQYAKSGQYEQVQKVLLGDADAVGSSLQDSLSALVEYNEAKAIERNESNGKLASSASQIMFIVIFIGVILAITLGLLLARSISRPVNKIVAAADKLALGDLDITTDIDTKDEIGQLAKAFQKLIESTREQADIADSIANADLTVDVSARSEKDVLGKSLIQLVNSLNEIITNITSASEQVAAGSRQISDSSMALSQGATEQASSIEELTASIEEISSQTKINTENANQANDFAETAKSNAAKGNIQMKEMVKAMEEINESSNNISKIIKVIDDIAFQTNMLSLNAAVEAARAGQHGKGFAVVAEEVKNLAARSANAAKETTEMIEGSIRKAEIGTKIAIETAEALNRIVNEIEKVANLVSDISVASNEQYVGISQVNQGIMQVSQVVQTNSATSEESAAASEELSSQAELLQDMVSKFKLKKNTKTYSKLEELNPEILKMLESMSQKGKTNSNSIEGNLTEEAANNTKIALSDKEFGKYL